MNDLAEKALHGVNAAVRLVRARPLPAFGAAGAAAAVAVVGAGARVGAAGPTRPLTSWLGLQPRTAERHAPLAGAILLAALALLLVLWAAVVAFVARRRVARRDLWMVAAAWAAPFVVGPPLMDTGVYSSVAYGLLQRTRHDPYTTAPSTLGDVPVVAAIDPAARGTPSASGPLGSVVQHVVATAAAGNAVFAVLILRAVGLAALVVIGRYAVRLADRDSRSAGPLALALTVLNPLALLYVVNGAHLDGVMIAVVLAAVVAATRRRWRRAVVLASLAAAVSGQAYVAVAAVVVGHVAMSATRGGSRRRGGRGLAEVALLDLALVAAVVGATGLAVRNGFGWPWAVGDQFEAHTPFSAAGALATVLAPAVPGASYDDLAIGGRVTVLIALACAVGYLLGTVRRRPIDTTIGCLLLAAGLLAPVLHPWYVLWGVLVLAPGANADRRIAVLALSAAACLLTQPGFGDRTSAVLSFAGLAAVLATIVGWTRRRNAQRPPETSRTAGRTSAR